MQAAPSSSGAVPLAPGHHPLTLWLPGQMSRCPSSWKGVKPGEDGACSAASSGAPPLLSSMSSPNLSLQTPTLGIGFICHAHSTWPSDLPHRDLSVDGALTSLLPPPRGAQTTSLVLWMRKSSTKGLSCPGLTQLGVPAGLPSLKHGVGTPFHSSRHQTFTELLLWASTHGISFNLSGGCY